MAERVSFLIDGFNLYHSVCQALADGRVVHAKWLNSDSFCTSLLTDVVNFQRGARRDAVRMRFSRWLSSRQL